MSMPLQEQGHACLQALRPSQQYCSKTFTKIRKRRSIGTAAPKSRWVYRSLLTAIFLSTNLKGASVTIEREHSTLHSRCVFRHGDANTVLKAWCRERDLKKERAVVFLDPYGMQVEWSTIEALAATKAVDLWYLFPLGVGVLRLLTYRGDIEESCQARLDS